MSTNGKTGGKTGELARLAARLNMMLDMVHEEGERAARGENIFYLSKRPDYAVSIPGIKLGDVLYKVSLDGDDEAMSRAVVIHVTDGDYAICARLMDLGMDDEDEDDRLYRHMDWVHSLWSRTEKDALLSAANSSLEEHEAAAKLAREALAAANGTDDEVEQFLVELPFLLAGDVEDDDE